MVSLKNKKGFTIVELLIVIVVIGILATLVIVTFTGIQQKGRNTQRQTDIKALNSYVEAFYADYGFYPTGADMKNPDFITKYMKGLDRAALVDPKQDQSLASSTTDTGISSTSVTGYQYSYVAAHTGGGTGTCSTAATTIPTGTDATPADTGCDSYTLTAHLENASDYIKKSN